MKQKIHVLTAAAIFFLTVALYVVLAIAFPKAYIMATYEDCFGEWAQVFFFFVAMVLSVHLALSKSPYRLFFGVLALACFYVVGEEISWGQRLFDIQASGFFARNNLQQETNLHNFLTGPVNTALKRLIEGALFCAMVGYGLLYPLCVERGRWGVCQWLDEKGLPAPPLYLWPFFVTSGLLELRLFRFNEAELAEILIGQAMAFFALHYWINNGRKNPYPRSPRPLALGFCLAVLGVLAMAAISTKLVYDTPRLKEQLDSRMANGMEKFAERYIRFGRWQTAAALYQELHEAKPKNTELLRSLAVCYNELGRDVKYRHYLQQAIFIDMGRYGRNPMSVSVNLNLYQSFLVAGNASKARFHLEKAFESGRRKILLEPENASANYWLGKTYLASGDKSTAVPLLQKAVRLKPNSGQYRRLLQKVLAEMC